MKFIAIAAAGLIAASGLAATPAEAQRYGYGYDRGHDGWNDGRNWRGDRRDWRDDRRGWRGDNRGWRGDRGRGWGRDRSRVRCTWVRGWYGRERQCYRVYR
ncbi:MAG: hypothetical protein V4537_05720 [Pseudomonadota bacterium]